jgi:chemotaxis protein CheD
MGKKIIGIAEMHADKAPTVIVTLGLGSCVGVTLYDPTSKVGGMVHIMLPDSNGDPKGKPAKYADTAVPLLLEEVLKLGANKSKIVAKLAGGAQMLKFSRNNTANSIGTRNAEEAVKALKKANIKIVAQDTGGSYGRTIELDLENGKLLVKTVGYGKKEI